MRYLVITPLYAPSYSGAAVLFRKLSEGMVARGHQVTVVTANTLDYRAFWERSLAVDNLPSEETIKGVTVKRLSVWRKHSSKNYWRLVHYSWKYRLPYNDWLRTWYDGPILRGIDKVANVGGYDIVCAGHTPSMVVVYGQRIASKLNIPFVLIPGLHTDNAFNIDRANMRSIIRSSDALCANTEYEKRYLEKQFSIDSEKICITGCGVDMSEFAEGDGNKFRDAHGIPADACVILFVGAEVEHKGLLVLLNAMEHVWNKHDGARLVIAGVRSSASEKLDALLAANPKLRSRVIRCNSFTDEEKANIYDACDIFAMPSWSESFGIVYLEAWARRKPVIGCKGSAVETVITDGQDGLLVEPGNDAHLAEAILLLLSSSSKRKEMGDEGLNKVMNTYTWDHVVCRFEHACKSCVMR